MSDDLAISVQGVSKAYRIWETPAARLTSPMQAALGNFTGIEALRRKAARGYRDFWALENVSLEVKKGEAVGIIGRNGSGKSTLLQIIAGTLQPTAGTVKINGRVAALLELGSGFNPEFTGRENVYLNGALLGLSRDDIAARFPDIVAFAEIGDFIDQPVKTYSSGMGVRLAFAVQTAIEPDILIVDEALSVGDFFFQQKCFQRIREMRSRGTTLLFVSHDMGSVRDLCERALYLRKGHAVFFGDAQPAIAAYFQEHEKAPLPTEAQASPPRDALHVTEAFRQRAMWMADGEKIAPAATPVSLLGIAITDPANKPVQKASLDDWLHFQILFIANVDGAFHVALELKNRYDQMVSSVGSYTCGMPALTLKAGQTAIMEFRVQLRFEAGLYSCQAVMGGNVQDANRGTRLDASPWLGPIEVAWDYENRQAPFLGMFGPPVQAHYVHVAAD